MLSVGFSNSSIQTILNEEEGNNQSTHLHDVGDLETLLNINDFYKKKRKGPSERSYQSPIVTPKNTTSCSNAPTTHPFKKVFNSSSSGGGEKNILPGKIESSHKLPMRKKMKNLVQEEEDNIIENDIQRFSLEDMELEVDIEKKFLAMEQPENMAQQNSLLEVIGNETFSEEESFTFQSVVFYKESKKLIVERSDQKNKNGKSR